MEQRPVGTTGLLTVPALGLGAGQIGQDSVRNRLPIGSTARTMLACPDRHGSPVRAERGTDRRHLARKQLQHRRRYGARIPDVF